MSGNNCSQCVSTPPITWGKPRRPKTHIFMATSRFPAMGRMSFSFDAFDSANLTRRLGQSRPAPALRRSKAVGRLQLGRGSPTCSSERIPRSADLQRRPEEDSKVEPEAPVGHVPEV